MLRKMDKVVEITEIRKQQIKQQADRLLDVTASYAILESLIAYLYMNDLPELDSLRYNIEITMLELREILQNGG
jgi:hypothetical protein